MFFRSKAQKQTEAEQAKADVLKAFQHQLDEARKCADPAEKFLKLEECKDSIDEFISVTRDQIKMAARGKYKAPYIGIAGGTTIGAGILVLGLHFPPALILLAYPAIVGGAIVGKRAVQKGEAQLKEETRPFIEKLEEKRVWAMAAADVILKKDLTSLATSPRFEEIVQKAPRVRDHFTAAFARRAAEDEKRNPPQPRPPGNGGLQL